MHFILSQNFWSLKQAGGVFAYVAYVCLFFVVSVFVCNNVFQLASVDCSLFLLFEECAELLLLLLRLLLRLFPDPPPLLLLPVFRLLLDRGIPLFDFFLGVEDFVAEVEKSKKRRSKKRKCREERVEKRVIIKAKH